MNKLNYLIFALILLGASTDANSKIKKSETNEIQRVRIDFKTPLGFTRHLLLAFTPNDSATDGFDYGYDALNIDNYPDDLNWMIEDNRYVIQGVGAFNTSKCYPLGMFLSNSGLIEISLNSLENFETEINVYVYDALLGTFELINSQNYIETLTSGNYVNRFYVTFTNNINQLNISDSSLSINENYFKNTFINYLYKSKELLINTNNEFIIKEITFFNLNAQEVYKMDINSDKIKIPLHFLNSKSLIIKLVSQSGAQHFKHIITQ